MSRSSQMDPDGKAELSAGHDTGLHAMPHSPCYLLSELQELTLFLPLSPPALRESLLQQKFPRVD